MLIVMRHAKTEPFAVTDQQRALTARGRRDAQAAGRHLAADSTVADYALVSPAVRTVETWAAVSAASGSVAEAVLDDAVYAGSPGAVLEALRAVPETAQRVIFVGHNPTAAYLAHLLEDGEGETDIVHEMLLQGFVPCALAVLRLSTSWRELGAETTRLVDFHVGRG